MDDYLAVPIQRGSQVGGAKRSSPILS